ncbi:MAG: sporulation protein [Peptococcaceae bacterium]|nr:sporulation protein [Peptococcaceae bacterium]
MFNKVQKGIGEALEFPPDVAGEGPRISIIGREKVIVENYRAIIAFGAEQISLETMEGTLHLLGQDLVLDALLPTELHITGWLTSLRFEGGRGHA